MSLSVINWYEWVPPEEVNWGGWVRGGRFFGSLLQNSIGPFLRTSEYVERFPSSCPVNWHPFGANWLKGTSVNVTQSQCHMRMGLGRRGCGVVKLGGQFVDSQASCGCLAGQMDGELKEQQQYCSAV
eukprot:397580-Pelagomonas_calceolata.AAC.9